MGKFEGTLNKIHINPLLTIVHRRVLHEYLRGEGRLTREQWHILREAIDLLEQSSLVINEQEYTFKHFYNEFIDRRFAEPFLQALVRLTDVEKEAARLQAATAREIVAAVRRQEFYRQGDSNGHLLLIFCLYWWAAFAIGYHKPKALVSEANIFEVEIFRDLEAAGIPFVSHEITNRTERFSAYDLTVLGLRGDIKYSTYFLTSEGTQTTEIDFFITRLFDETNARWEKVVFLTPTAWAVINGRTILVALQKAVSVFPKAVSVEIGLETFVIILYNEWKERILKKGGAK